MSLTSLTCPESCASFPHRPPACSPTLTVLFPPVLQIPFFLSYSYSKHLLITCFVPGSVLSRGNRDKILIQMPLLFFLVFCSIPHQGQSEILENQICLTCLNDLNVANTFQRPCSLTACLSPHPISSDLL